MNEKDDFYSMMIREGMITRDQALEHLKMEEDVHWDRAVDFLRLQGIKDIARIERTILSSPKLSPMIKEQVEASSVVNGKNVKDRTDRTSFDQATRNRCENL
jgi:hypothetical protein